jgi:RNA polymerase sigma-70 factor (ECF subfamily)
MTTQSTLRARRSANADGDAGSLRRQSDATRKPIYGLILAVLGTRDGADEVLVDTYVQVWRRAQGYDERRGSVQVWVSSIARHRAIDRLRARRRGTLSLAEACDWEAVSAPGPTPLQASVEGEAQGEVRHALERLTYEQRRAVEAVFFEGLSHTQAAEALGQPLGTLKGRVRAAMTVLRRELGIREEGAV